MSRLLAWVSGAVSGIAAYKLLTRRRATAAPPLEAPAEPVTPDPRAEALRARLEAQEEPPGPEEAPDDPDVRRAHVHDTARAAVERMRHGPGR